MLKAGTNVSLTTKDQDFLDNWKQNRPKRGHKRKAEGSSSSNTRKVVKHTIENEDSEESEDTQKPVNETSRHQPTPVIPSTTIPNNLPLSTIPAYDVPVTIPLEQSHISNEQDDIQKPVNEISLHQLTPVTFSTAISNNLPLSTIPAYDVPVTIPFEQSHLSNTNYISHSTPNILSLPGGATASFDSDIHHHDHTPTLTFSTFKEDNMCSPLSPIPSTPGPLNSTFINVGNCTNASITNSAIDVQVPSTNLDDSPILELSRKIDLILSNQQLIIQGLRNFGFALQLPSEANETTASKGSMTSECEKQSSTSGKPPSTIATHHELTIEELRKINNVKRKNTTDGYFAVMLLKRLTTTSERANCTVYGEGKNSKGLNPSILSKIKSYYTSLYSEETWNDAVTAMNSHLRKYCAKKQE